MYPLVLRAPSCAVSTGVSNCRPCSGFFRTFPSEIFLVRKQKGRVHHHVYSKISHGLAPLACLHRDNDDGDDDGDDDSDDDTTSAEVEGLSLSFHEEVRRRQGADNGARKSIRDADRTFASPNGKAPRFVKDAAPESGQLDRSRELQNEGLKGFPLRARDLVTLGLTSFTSFGPLIAVFSVLFVATYLILGSDFIHGGDMNGSSPSFVSPEGLLREDTVDTMVLFAGPRVE